MFSGLYNQFVSWKCIKFAHSVSFMFSEIIKHLYFNTLDSNWHCTGNQIVLLFPINTEIIFYFGDNDEGHGWLSSGKYSDK